MGFRDFGFDFGSGLTSFITKAVEVEEVRAQTWEQANPEAAEISATVWAITHTPDLDIGYLAPADRRAQAINLLAVRRTQGEAAYQAQLADIVRYAGGVILANSLEQDTGDRIRAVAASVAPIVLGPVVGAATQAALMGGGVAGAAGAAVGAVLAASAPPAPPQREPQPVSPSVRPLPPVMAAAAPAPAAVPYYPAPRYRAPQPQIPYQWPVALAWGLAFQSFAWPGFY